MTFDEWFNSAPHRKKYTTDHPVYLAALEAWEAAHEVCAGLCDEIEKRKWETVMHGGEMQGISARDCAAAIRARAE